MIIGGLSFGVALKGHDREYYLGGLLHSRPSPRVSALLPCQGDEYPPESSVQIQSLPEVPAAAQHPSLILAPVGPHCSSPFLSWDAVPQGSHILPCIWQIRSGPWRSTETNYEIFKKCKMLLNCQEWV